MKSTKNLTASQTQKRLIAALEIANIKLNKGASFDLGDPVWAARLADVGLEVYSETGELSALDQARRELTNLEAIIGLNNPDAIARREVLALRKKEDTEARERHRVFKERESALSLKDKARLASAREKESEARSLSSGIVGKNRRRRLVRRASDVVYNLECDLGLRDRSPSPGLKN